jgi:hypothetical protein
MSDALFSANEFVAPNIPSAAQRATRTGFFSRLVEALHHSRRLQAEHTLRQYRHLIDARWHEFDPQSDIGRRNDVVE